MGMLDSEVMKQKKQTNKSSKEILAARDKSIAMEVKKRAGRPAKYPRDNNTKRMNIFIPGYVHKKLRQASVDEDASMNEIIIDALLDRFK